MTTAVKTLSSSPMMVKVFGVIPSRASGCMSCMTRCLTRCCMRLLNIILLYHTLYLEERCCQLYRLSKSHCPHRFALRTITFEARVMLSSVRLSDTHKACLTSLFSHTVADPAQGIFSMPTHS